LLATFNVEAQLYGACTIKAVWADSGLITATWDVQVRCCHGVRATVRFMTVVRVRVRVHVDHTTPHCDRLTAAAKVVIVERVRIKIYHTTPHHTIPQSVVWCGM